ncbi:MAG: hypothetical protein ACSHX0_01790 [Akkermansiaceae bacterium]
MQAHQNPFATDRVEKLLRFDPLWSGLTWAEIELRWCGAGYACAVTGRHGAGKTTLLDAWRQRMLRRGENVLSLFLNRQSHGLDDTEWAELADVSQRVVILDGEEQLTYLQRRKFYQLTREAKGLIVTRHRQNHLKTIVHLDPQRNVLDRCVRLVAPEYVDLLEPHLDLWWKEKQGNLREILLCCYDVVSEMDGVQIAR